MKRRSGKFSCLSTVALSAVLLGLYKKTKDRGLLCPLAISVLKWPLAKLTLSKEEVTDDNVDE